MSITPTILPDRLKALDTITLDEGAHLSYDDGMCAMEAVAFLAGEGITDAPQCASPVLRYFTITLNDKWDYEDRQRLVPYLPRMVGTAGDGQDEARSYLALDWLIRSCTPAWLDLAGLTEQARALRDLRRIVDLAAAESAGPIMRDARNKSSAAWAAAWDAAGTAADDAAWAAAWDAAGTAADDAAWAAAGAAAVTAADDAAGAAAVTAALAVADDAARAAAAVLREVRLRGGVRALRPIMQTIQTSVLQLLDAMIDPGTGYNERKSWSLYK